MHVPNDVVARLFELHGGRDRFFAIEDERNREFDAVWDQDAEGIGRVLRSHLAVEHFMTELLSHMNPCLGSVDNARLAFSQKVELLPDEPSLSYLKPGLRRLNVIRNRIAHRLRVDINAEDRGAILGIRLYAALRAEKARRFGPEPDDPLSVVEQFAMFAAGLLHRRSTEEWDLWQQAVQTPTEDAQPSPGDCPRGAAEDPTGEVQE